MIKKLYEVTLAKESLDGYRPNIITFKVFAKTAEEVINKVRGRIKESEFVDEIRNCGVVEV